METNLFNQFLTKRINDYLNIKIDNMTFSAPYALNVFGIALKQAIDQVGIDKKLG